MRSQGRDGERGQSMVEFALALPVMLLIVTGICAFGISISHYMLLTDATNVAARQLAISRGQTTDPCSLASTTVLNAAPILTPASFTFKLVLNGTTYTGTSCSSSSPTTGAAGNMTQNSNAQITVTYPCSLAVFGNNLVPVCTLQAQTTELVQ